MTTTTAAEPASVSFSHAAGLLGVGARQLRALIAAGRLTIAGRGHGKKIVVQSLVVELERRTEKRHLLPFFALQGLFSSPATKQTEDVVMRTITAESIQLLPITAAGAPFHKLLAGDEEFIFIVGRRKKVGNQ